MASSCHEEKQMGEERKFACGERTAVCSSLGEFAVAQIKSPTHPPTHLPIHTPTHASEGRRDVRGGEYTTKNINLLSTEH